MTYYPAERPQRPRIVGRFLPLIIFVGVMWFIRIADDVLPGSFNQFGLRSWDWGSMWGIATAPFLHKDWTHLLSNTMALLALGSLISLQGAKRFWTVVGISALISGLGVFFVNAPGTLTVGASGVAFGVFGYLMVEGMFERRFWPRIRKLGLSILIFMFWGIPMLIGLLPIQEGVSWQGHLFGLIGGILAAMIVHRASGPDPLRPAQSHPRI